MKARLWSLGVLLVVWGLVVNCGSGGTGGTDGAAGSSGVGTEISSCTLSDGSLCTQLIIPSTSSARSAEQSQCTTLQNGTSGMSCATTGIVGCCLPKAGAEQGRAVCLHGDGGVRRDGALHEQRTDLVDDDVIHGRQPTRDVPSTRSS